MVYHIPRLNERWHLATGYWLPGVIGRHPIFLA